MSKENYRRLGNYIREVDVRNRNLGGKELMTTIYVVFIVQILTNGYLTKLPSCGTMVP
jgi:hypothetical protein